MKRILLPLLTLTVPAFAFAQAGIVQSPAYKECIALSTANPMMALKKAEEWLAIDNGIAAQHCGAMALYGAKRYAEAGDKLNNLRFAIPEENLTLRSFVTKQAATAWKNANRADAALAVLDLQIGEMKGIKGANALTAKLAADLLLERARLHVIYGKTGMAMQDLDHAVSLTPLNVDILNERAATFTLLGDYSLARADAESVLKLNPSDAKARGLLAKLDKIQPK